MMLHIYSPQTMSLPSINILHLMTSDIQCDKLFPINRPNTHLDAMGENNTAQPSKAVGLKL